MKRVPLNRYLVFVTIAAIGCAVDLATKHWVFGWLGMPRHDEFKVWWIWEPYFGLQTSTNQGALFGVGQGKVWLFAVASFVALVGISYWLFVAGAARDWLLTVALAVVMGGVLGNLHDRLGLWAIPEMPGARMHAVRDWILFQWPPWQWPNFNIADSLLVSGGALLFVHALTQPARGDQKHATPANHHA
ncbi:MAG TPA: signal peptidase II [Pirellulales bacterium]|jgi:signal peptidase II